jgi:GNAT superfamily N-acetyltransferase
LDLSIEITPATEAVRQAILTGLAEFNASNGYPSDLGLVAMTLKEKDQIVGGLWGKTVYGWLFVEYLIVPEQLRGRDLGLQLMLAAEEIAVQRGCVGAWLTTFSFQARGFYEKLGYSVFGELENSPGENVRIFLRKRF